MLVLLAGLCLAPRLALAQDLPALIRAARAAENTAKLRGITVTRMIAGASENSDLLKLAEAMKPELMEAGTPAYEAMVGEYPVLAEVLTGLEARELRAVRAANLLGTPEHDQAISQLQRMVGPKDVTFSDEPTSMWGRLAEGKLIGGRTAANNSQSRVQALTDLIGQQLEMHGPSPTTDALFKQLQTQIMATPQRGDAIDSLVKLTETNLKTAGPNAAYDSLLKALDDVLEASGTRAARMDDLQKLHAQAAQRSLENTMAALRDGKPVDEVKQLLESATGRIESLEGVGYGTPEIFWEQHNLIADAINVAENGGPKASWAALDAQRYMTRALSRLQRNGADRVFNSLLQKAKTQAAVANGGGITSLSELTPAMAKAEKSQAGFRYAGQPVRRSPLFDNAVATDTPLNKQIARIEEYGAWTREAAQMGPRAEVGRAAVAKADEILDQINELVKGNGEVYQLTELHDALQDEIRLVVGGLGPNSEEATRIMGRVRETAVPALRTQIDDLIDTLVIGDVEAADEILDGASAWVKTAQSTGQPLPEYLTSEVELGTDALELAEKGAGAGPIRAIESEIFTNRATYSLLNDGPGPVAERFLEQARLAQADAAEEGINTYGDLIPVLKTTGHKPGPRLTQLVKSRAPISQPIDEVDRLVQTSKSEPTVLAELQDDATIMSQAVNATPASAKRAAEETSALINQITERLKTHGADDETLRLMRRAQRRGMIIAQGLGPASTEHQTHLANLQNASAQAVPKAIDRVFERACENGAADELQNLLGNVVQWQQRASSQQLVQVGGTLPEIPASQAELLLAGDAVTAVRMGAKPGEVAALAAERYRVRAIRDLTENNGHDFGALIIEGQKYARQAEAAGVTRLDQLAPYLLPSGKVSPAFQQGILTYRTIDETLLDAVELQKKITAAGSAPRLVDRSLANIAKLSEDALVYAAENGENAEFMNKAREVADNVRTVMELGTPEQVGSALENARGVMAGATRHYIDQALTGLRNGRSGPEIVAPLNEGQFWRTLAVQGEGLPARLVDADYRMVDDLNSLLENLGKAPVKTETGGLIVPGIPENASPSSIAAAFDAERYSMRALARLQTHGADAVYDDLIKSAHDAAWKAGEGGIRNWTQFRDSAAAVPGGPGFTLRTLVDQGAEMSADVAHVDQLGQAVRAAGGPGKAVDAAIDSAKELAARGAAELGNGMTPALSQVTDDIARQRNLVATFGTPEQIKAFDAGLGSFSGNALQAHLDEVARYAAAGDGANAQREMGQVLAWAERVKNAELPKGEYLDAQTALAHEMVTGLLTPEERAALEAQRLLIKATHHALTHGSDGLEPILAAGREAAKRAGAIDGVPNLRASFAGRQPTPYTPSEAVSSVLVGDQPFASAFDSLQAVAGRGAGSVGNALAKTENGVALVNPLWLPRQDISQFIRVVDWVDLSMKNADQPGFREGMKGVQAELERAMGTVPEGSPFRAAMEPVAAKMEEIIGGNGSGAREAQELQALLERQLGELGFQIERPALGDMFDVNVHDAQAPGQLGQKILVGGKKVKATPGMITGVNGPTIRLADGTVVRPAPVSVVPEGAKAPK